MRAILSCLFLTTALSGAALAASSPAEILAANKAAMGGSAWDNKATIALSYDYAGQGLTGTTSSLQDVRRGAFVDSYTIGTQSGATGWTGEKAWEREPSGTITDQAGGDVIPLAITEAYQDQNLWWRPDFGGAQVESLGQKTEDGKTFDVLKVIPKGGAALEAWFDSTTHLLARTSEVQGSLTITVYYSDYAPQQGVQIARKQVVDDTSGVENRQTYTLTGARFLPEQSSVLFTKPRANVRDFSLAGGVTETTIPFTLANNHIYADVSVNGSKPMTFILDTGGHNILTPQTAKALNIQAQGSMTSSGGGADTAQSGMAKADSIRAGAATLTDQPITTLDFFKNPGVEGVNEQGMIGYEFFARFITRFDYGKHTVTFIDKAHFDPSTAGTPVPMRLYHQFPEILGSYDGIPGRFGIDTGSRMPLQLSGPFATHNNIRAKVKNGAEAMTGWGVGGPTYSYVFRGGVLKLGDVTINNPLTMISTDKGGAGAAEAFPNNVGGGVLKRFVVTFDYDHSLMYLKPVDGPVADLDTFDRSGMWFNETPEGLKVVNLTKGGPAEQAGLLKDDVIVSVDGKPASSQPLYAWREQFRRDAPGTKVTLAVKRGGGTRNVAVTLRDLI